MEIFIWRHGKAEAQSLSGSDGDRRLLPQGSADVLKLARQLKDKNEKIEKIFTSPYLRAKETSESIQEVLKCPGGIEELPQLGSGVPMKYLVNSLRKIEGCDSLVLVGHMPDLGIMADYILGKSSREKISLSAGEVIKISIPGPIEAGTGTKVYRLAP